jgi:SAM-dependent methyltransferase
MGAFPAMPIVRSQGRVNTSEKLRAVVPVEVRSWARYALGLGRDVGETLSRRADPTLPPHRLRFVGQGDFRAIGEELVRQMVEVGGLKPTDSVLDIGCGIGRIAIPMTGYLSPEGSYRGFDIVPRAINWCSRNVASQHENFSFDLARVGNSLYRRSQEGNAASLRFPYHDDSFDFVLATSVFTHLLPDTMANYVKEMARVLKPGGTAFTTWLLLNDGVRSRLPSLAPPMNFPWDYGHYAVDNERVPEAATAHDEDRVREIFGSVGLAIREPIDFSSWNGDHSLRPGQDLVIATKAALH